jgi:hypothetical protein
MDLATVFEDRYIQVERILTRTTAFLKMIEPVRNIATEGFQPDCQFNLYVNCYKT